MTPKEYIALYEKYMAGNCTPEEEAYLFNYQDSFKLQEPNQPLSEQERNARLQGYRQLTDRINRPTKTARLGVWWTAAAILILSIAGLLVFRETKETSINIAHHAPILPGKPMATLTLGNGKKIALDEAANGLIAQTSGSNITKTKNGEIVYAVANPNKNEYENSENTISVPAGGEYQVTIPDGTKVWLNSASQLSYPARFKGNKRLVKLVGEAYFEVAKHQNALFIVQAGHTKTEVLGTHFNVMAYENEGQVKTTLLKGSVRFSSGHSNALMKPGQQGTAIAGAGDVQINLADTTEVMAWREGYFVFKNENIKSLMRRIARWYNIEVIYKGNVEQRVYGGTFSKKKNLSELLTNLEQIGTVHFETNGRRVTVMP